MRRSTIGVLAIVLAIIGTARARAGEDLTDLDLDGLAGVRPAPPANEANPGYFFLSGAASLLIERSHGENFDVTGFTDYLASQGWSIANQTLLPITLAALEPYDVVLVPVGVVVTPFSDSEVDAFEEYLESGGALWVFHEYATDPAAVNSLCSRFGLSFNYDQLRDSTNNEGNVFWPTIRVLTPHPVTDQVSTYGLYAGPCLDPGSSTLVLATGDDDTQGFLEGCLSFPPVLAAMEVPGRAVFSCDITPLHSAYYPERLREEEQRLLQNIANWLVASEPTATNPTTWGTIKGVFTR